MNIFVGNIPYTTKEDNLRDHFAQIGSVESVKIIYDRYSGQSRGFGFVEMEDELGKKAIEELNGKDLGGRQLVVNEAQPRRNNRRE